jgi:uncharacterized protein (DUF1800 family)
MKRLPFLLLALLLAIGASNSQTKDQKLTERQRALHALNRLGFGPRPGDVERVLATGVDKWIEQQLHPERIADPAMTARLAAMPTLALSNREIIEQFYVPLVALRKEAKEAKKDATDPKDDGEADVKAMLKDLPPGKRPGRVMGELQSQRILRAVESDRQLNEVMVDFWMNHFNVFAGKGIDRFLLTSYERDVIRPNIWGRFDELLLATAKAPAMLFYLDNARSRRGALNENYAREIMELHTLGVDGGYTQSDVTEMARVLTGWSITGKNDARGAGFVFRPFLHDREAKKVLGVSLRAGGGMEEGEMMIRMLARQPATARHLARKLCQRLVADDPPASLVDRVAKTFLDCGGDLRKTVKSVIDSREFWNPAVYRAKVKSPFEYVVSAARAVDAKIDNPLPIAKGLQQMGEPLYGAQPPTGYSDKAEAWINTGALMSRLNFALGLAANRIPGVRSSIAADASVDSLAQSLTGGELTAETKATIASKEAQGAVAVGLILGSPEFQRQ